VDIYSLLEADHRKVTDLFARAAETAEPRELEAAFREIKRMLELHREAEERTFYAVLSNLPEIAERIEEAMEEHVDVEELLEELSNLAAEDDDFRAQLNELREEVEHHVREEEGELFSQARKLLDDDQAARIAEEFQAEKEGLAAA
jgi:iron-sulfur cluster repair protein YtfE (RIC family)